MKTKNHRPNPVTAAAATLLDQSGYPTVAVVKDMVSLTNPSTALRAAEFLTDRGFDATAQQIGGRWVLIVTEDP